MQSSTTGRGLQLKLPELAAFLLALRDTLIKGPLLYLCDNQSLMKAVNRWISEGGKTTLVGAPDTDILAVAIEILRKRIAVGIATFLVKVKVLQQNTEIDDRKLSKSCVRCKNQTAIRCRLQIMQKGTRTLAVRALKICMMRRIGT